MIKTIGNIALEWFSNLSMNEHHLQGLLKYILASGDVGDVIQRVWFSGSGISALRIGIF